MRLRRKGFGHDAAQINHPARRFDSDIGLAWWGRLRCGVLTSLVLVEARALNVWRDPELALVFISRTSFSAVFFGSSVAGHELVRRRARCCLFRTRRTTAFSLTILDTLLSWGFFPAAGD